MAFLDMAYQGFGNGIAEDGAVIGKFVAAGLDFFVSTSFSKSFSLYGERVGALSVLCQNKEEADRVLSPAQDRDPHQLQQPAHPRRRRGGRRAEQPRAARPVGKGTGRDARAHQGHAPEAGDGLKAAGVKQDMSFITQQIGMFSYSGLTKDQMVRLRSEFGVYGTDTGRMCVAALNSKNIDYVCQAIAKVM